MLQRFREPHSQWTTDIVTETRETFRIKLLSVLGVVVTIAAFGLTPGGASAHDRDHITGEARTQVLDSDIEVPVPVLDEAPLELGPDEIDPETSGKRVGRRKAEISDARLIANKQGWQLRTTLAHIKVQKTFGDLLASLSKKYPESYAGGIFADEPGATSLIRFVGEVPTLAAEEARRTGIRVTLQGDAAYSEDELQKKSRKLHSYLLSLGFEEVVTAVTPNDGIVASVRSTSEQVPELPEALNDGVRVYVSTSAVSRPEHTRGGARVLDDGSFECTSGFAVESFRGVTGVTTAGHCTGINQYEQPSDGLVYSLTHQAEHQGIFGDVEWKTSSHIEPAEYFARASELRDVTSVLAFGGLPVNSFSCVYGRSSNLRACDRVFSTFVTVTSSGTTLSFLIGMDNDNTIPGDSGGPWSFGTMADGSHVGDAFLSGGWRNIWTQASLFPLSIGVSVRTK